MDSENKENDLRVSRNKAHFKNAILFYLESLDVMPSTTR